MRMKDVGTGTTGEAVLVVDLDGTLCRTDTLHETLLGLVARRPTEVLARLGRLRQGRAAFKRDLVATHILAGDALPLNDAVLDIVRRARADGRRTALVTATHQRQADAVATATGLFDDVFGTDGGGNLKGAAKARFLTERYGAKGFDYVGDSRADLPVWAAARKAVTVGASPSLVRAAEAANPDVIHLDPPKGRSGAMLRAMRPHQWSKNALLFLPVLAAHEMSALGAVFLGFLAFCLTASAVYVINDLVDLPADRAHPRKRLRPFAAGELSALTGVVMAGGLLLGAAALGALIGNPLFLGVLSLYLVVTFAYSLWLKRKLLVDVLTLAGLYTIRIMAGGAAAGIVLSPWLLGFSMFLFLSLASVKRQAELMDQRETGRAISGRAYLPDDLPILMALAISSGQAAVVVLALYITSDTVGALYASPQLLWLVVPLLLYWVLRMVMMTHRGYMTDDPIVFAARDKISLMVVASVILIVLAASFGAGS
jgi:4-hydroxybenzoate polyprenyltransferase/phosphoserine phosphatase